MLTWWNGIHDRLRTCARKGVGVRVPPSALMASVFSGENGALIRRPSRVRSPGWLPIGPVV